MAESSIEAFDVGVLIRLARLDVVEPDAVVPAPVGKDLRQIFRPVVDADRFGFAATLNQPIQCPDYPGTRDRCVDDDIQDFPDAFIQDIQRAKAATAIERVAHKVHGPFRIGAGIDKHRLLYALWQPSLGPPG